MLIQKIRRAADPVDDRYKERRKRGRQIRDQIQNIIKSRVSAEHRWNVQRMQNRLCEQQHQSRAGRAGKQNRKSRVFHRACHGRMVVQGELVRNFDPCSSIDAGNDVHEQRRGDTQIAGHGEIGLPRVLTIEPVRQRRCDGKHKVDEDQRCADTPKRARRRDAQVVRALSRNSHRRCSFASAKCFVDSA